MLTVEDIKRIAEIEFVDIVKNTSQIEYKLRIFLVNNSFIDVYLSQRLPDKFGFHWECRDEKGTFYRYDNFPDKNWQKVETFPYHFHNGSQDSVEASPFPLSPIEGFLGTFSVNFEIWGIKACPELDLGSVSRRTEHRAWV